MRLPLIKGVRGIFPVQPPFLNGQGARPAELQGDFSFLLAEFLNDLNFL